MSSTDRVSVPRIAITPGEPAGIGPELTAMIAAESIEAELIAIADPDLLRQRSDQLGLNLHITRFDPTSLPARHRPGTLPVMPMHLARPSHPGMLDPANADYVLATLRDAALGCNDGTYDAMVTAPVNKAVINDAGHPFTGHTEFLAVLTGAAMPVMMLAAGGLRVALATTHLPLREVSAALTSQRLDRVARILHHDLQLRFGIATPRILVCGLNPHAGEGGHLGDEEIRIIEPVLERLRRDGMDLAGPLPADTLFTPRHLEGADAVLAMYHDQGLTVLKYAGFGRAVNITLGLPIIRPSVDHGTALDLAGTGRAEPGSLRAALDCAVDLVNRGRVAARSGSP
jgi:4-hydroxythreonine-4-phosphate dehydrogenase